jgi:hypothetical protein
VCHHPVNAASVEAAYILLSPYDSIPSLEPPPPQFGPEPYSSLRTSGPHLSGFAQHKILGQIYLSLSTIHPTVKTVGFLVEFDVTSRYLMREFTRQNVEKLADSVKEIIENIS